MYRRWGYPTSKPSVGRIQARSFQYSDTWRNGRGDQSHGWVVRGEKRMAGLFVIDLLEINICADGAGSGNGRSAIDRQEQSFQVGIRAEWIVYALQYS